MLRLAIFIVGLLLMHVASASASGEAPSTVYHALWVRLNPESRELHVEDRFTVDAKDNITFDLAPWLTLVETRVDGRRVQVDRVGRRVSLSRAGEGLAEVDVVLRGLVPRLSHAERRTGSEGAVADREGSYLPSYSAWMPDIGSNKIDYELTIEVPAPYSVVATGRLAEERFENDTYRASFAAENPNELPSIFAGPYKISERHEANLRVRTYFHSELAPLADEYMSLSVAYIRSFAARIGAYPYADFHIVSAPLPVGLGFSNLTYVGRTVLPLPFMRGRSLAHEIMHSWLGNGIAVDYGRGSWAEGLTTYLADYYLANQGGKEAARTMRLAWLRNINALPPAQDVPVERFTAKTHDAAQVVGYDKVAFIFHLLEAEVGESAFNAGLQQFWENQRFRVADWSDLQAAFEQTAKKDLSWFFEQWLRRAGTPRIELLNAQRKFSGEEFRVEMTIRQSAPPYRLRLPIVVESSNGPVSYEVMLEQSESTLELATEYKPLAVHIDPDFNTLRKLLPGESPPIFREVTLAPETVLVVPPNDASLETFARRLASRLLQREPVLYDGDLQALENAPVLMIGSSTNINEFRMRMRPIGNAAEVDSMVNAGTARAWVQGGSGGAPWLFVTADDAKSLEAIVGPLPHYRSQSYVIFDKTKAVRKGLWQGRTSPLSRRFEE